MHRDKNCTLGAFQSVTREQLTPNSVFEIQPGSGCVHYFNAHFKPILPNVKT